MILIMISNNEYNDSYSGINTDICYPFVYSMVNSTDSLAPAASAQTEGKISCVRLLLPPVLPECPPARALELPVMLLPVRILSI